MRQSIRRQFLFLRAYAVATSLVVVMFSVAAFRQTSKPQNLGEITVERLNVVDGQRHVAPGHREQGSHAPWLASWTARPSAAVARPARP